MLSRRHIPQIVLVFAVLGSVIAQYLIVGGLAWESSRPRYIFWSIGVVVGFSIFFIWLMFHGGAVSIIRPTTLARKMRLWVIVVTLYGIFEMFWGFANQSPLGFLVGDTFKYLLLGLGFLLTHSLLSTSYGAKNMLALLAGLSFFPGLGVGSEGFLASYFLAARATSSKKIYLIFLLLTMIFTASQGKTALLLVLFIVFLAGFIMPKYSFRRVLMYLVLSMLLVSVVWLMFPDAIKSTGSYKKSALFLGSISRDYTELDASTYQRIHEITLVNEKYETQANILHWIFGFGNGSIFKASGLPAGYQELLDTKFNGTAHHIHINPVFIFHQWGIVGVLLFFWLLVLIFGGGVSLMRRAKFMRSDDLFVVGCSYLMLVSFLFYGLVNPPKDTLLYAGMIMGIYVNGLSFSRLECRLLKPLYIMKAI